MYFKHIQFDDKIVLYNAEKFYRGNHGWYSIRKILSLETKYINLIFDHNLPGSSIQNYARYTLGQHGWKNYLNHNLQELSVTDWRSAEMAVEAEQPFALFAEIDKANKHRTGQWVDSVLDPSLHWYCSVDNRIRLMEIQSRKNKDQYLLFIVLGKIPQENIAEADWEESILVLRANKPFNLREHPDHLTVIKEIHEAARVAYKNRSAQGPIIFKAKHNLSIFRVGLGNIYIAEEHGVLTDEIPDDVMQDSLTHLPAAVREAFREACTVELKTIGEYLDNPAIVPDCLPLLMDSLETYAAKTGGDSISEVVDRYFNPLQNREILLTGYSALGMFYDVAKKIIKCLDNPVDFKNGTEIPALSILAEIQQHNDKVFKDMGDGSLYKNRKYFLEVVQRKLLRLEEQAIPPGCIVIDRNLTDSMVQVYRNAGAAGIIALDTSETSHASLKAKGLQFPFLIGVDEEILDYLDRRDHDRPADEVIFYGDELTINPQSAYKRHLLALANRNNPHIFIKRFPNYSVVLNGEEIKFKTNFFYTAGEELIEPLGGEIGLLRDEMLPKGTLAELREIFLKIGRLAPQGLTWRTLDVSRIDKLPDSIGLPAYQDNQASLLDYIRGTAEAYAWVQVRTQAFFAAQQELGTPFNIMYPMIHTPQDFNYYHENFYEPARVLFPAARVREGVMIETPSAVRLIQDILPPLDFISIGSNDLTMFTLRQDERQKTIKGLTPSVLDALQTAINAANSTQKEVSVCGDMASNPIMSVILLALGKTNLSAGDNYASAVNKQACAYVLEKGLLPEIRRILENTGGQDYAENVYAQVLEIFKDDAELYNYFLHNYALNPVTQTPLPS
ncbi:putative signal transduction protein PtsP super family [Candidatus Termititenax persephonae]|uniref:Signal transduction protein PtsP super family n=1 Tax=Candidatus Termititenax persephonae TaxID=2218525 RepID=A0A388TGT3_9BACT|nr:putative signal transduction protein PtsP super family [Candidatus Termititenax persephonae]